MVSIRVREIVIDHPRGQSKHLLEFYAALTGFRAFLNEVHPSLLENEHGSDHGVDLGLQPVDGYQPPTWPTQERGQQMHIDFATPDLEVAATFAESIGATRSGYQPAEDLPNEDFIVMVDPAGHPFCFVRHHEPFDGPLVPRSDGRPSVTLRMPFIDCPDHRALADFYLRLLHGTPIGETDDEYSAIRTRDGFPIGFQRADGYQPPTWPTQQRGQQVHMDLAVDDLAAAKAHAIACGATVAHEPTGAASHVVMLDPVGHPFCLGQDADGE